MHPVFLKIGNFVIYWYGVMVAAGALVGSFIFQSLARKRSYSESEINRIIFVTLASGIIGARIVHVFANYHYYSRHILEIIMLRNGGLAIQGGILFGLAALIVLLKTMKLNVAGTLDMVALSVPVGQAIGRIGCFLNGCCYGKQSNCFIGVTFPGVERRVHPTELYYMAGDLLIFWFLLLFYHDKHQDGEIAAWYLIFFGSLRYWLDHFRGDLIPSEIGLYSTQIFGIICFLAGALWIFRISFRQKTI
jgi:phosphatidylglycerol:prolipoprotein diacylglycerol transferase